MYRLKTELKIKGSNGTFRSKPIGHSIDMDDFETDSEDDELLCRGWPFVF